MPNDHTQGNTAADTVDNLRSLFCGCKFITRGVSINLLDGNSQIFREEDFNVFYHLQEISNYLYLNNVNVNGGRIIFPNLRIIRGKRVVVLNKRYLLAVWARNVNASELVLPRLTEISRGGVTIVRSPMLLSQLRGVLWSDIIDQTEFAVRFNGANLTATGEQQTGSMGESFPPAHPH